MEPIADSEIKRVLVINAHPDDSDFGASGTIAQWVKKGIQVSYVLCTNGDQGGEESGIAKEDMPEVRQREQREAGAVIGVTDIIQLRSSRLNRLDAKRRRYCRGPGQTSNQTGLARRRWYFLEA